MAYARRTASRSVFGEWRGVKDRIAALRRRAVEPVINGQALNDSHNFKGIESVRKHEDGEMPIHGDAGLPGQVFFGILDNGAQAMAEPSASSRTPAKEPASPSPSPQTAEKRRSAALLRARLALAYGGYASVPMRRARSFAILAPSATTGLPVHSTRLPT
ncbi:hypothetical protein [Pseudodesulfovibrio sp.]|uniref:hypothetical protein n=1 Tax=Pseudodesulfovibrio sp. TaxID=2035812 RepID=UPI00262218B0|nr:hypothetical protein [Pseudodesulfovibrio sp.]MDD3311658.1 hypothetical protein [Pseudodesulfovibrio sp.]